jgi:diaminopimelate decarboxylase
MSRQHDPQTVDALRARHHATRFKPKQATMISEPGELIARRAGQLLVRGQTVQQLHADD